MSPSAACVTAGGRSPFRFSGQRRTLDEETSEEGAMTRSWSPGTATDTSPWPPEVPRPPHQPPYPPYRPPETPTEPSPPSPPSPAPNLPTWEEPDPDWAERHIL